MYPKSISLARRTNKKIPALSSLKLYSNQLHHTDFVLKQVIFFRSVISKASETGIFSPLFKFKVAPQFKLVILISNFIDLAIALLNIDTKVVEQEYAIYGPQREIVWPLEKIANAVVKTLCSPKVVLKTFFFFTTTLGEHKF